MEGTNKNLDNPINKKLWPKTCHKGWMYKQYEHGLVSVIIPTHNRSQLLKEAMGSVYSQTYRPIEMIVVDDGSTDCTAETVKEWADNCVADNHFKLHYFHQENSGAQVARNHGLIVSRGEFIQFLDSDDLLLRKKLENQVDALQKGGKDYVYSYTIVVDNRDTIKYTRGIGIAPEECQGKAFIASHLWHTNSPLFRRHVCISVGPWDEELNGCQEYEYAARVKAFGFQAAFIDKVHVKARLHDMPKISSQDPVEYGKAIDMATAKVMKLLETLGKDTRSERNRVASNLVANALRFARFGTPEDARRCIHQACHFSRGFIRPFLYVMKWCSDVISPFLILMLVKYTARIRSFRYSRRLE